MSVRVISAIHGNGDTGLAIENALQFVVVDVNITKDALLAPL